MFNDSDVMRFLRVRAPIIGERLKTGVTVMEGVSGRRSRPKGLPKSEFVRVRSCERGEESVVGIGFAFALGVVATRLLGGRRARWAWG